ncbi:hypothetical protein ARMGADRAFT_1016945 [Armillaria gallica]|uniref:Uncharacterized protein n=1 Tax=Armillaria gallica TaxID=47427 RepID=A0A2H3CV09_ARMGA|nr:hypothetical protein ARMGADRAFT_1016945 [Armillaria gallica]
MDYYGRQYSQRYPATFYGYRRHSRTVHTRCLKDISFFFSNASASDFAQGFDGGP